MTFERPWVLLFLALPAAWALFQWRASGLVKQGRLRLVLKALALVAVVAALAEPRVESTESKLPSRPWWTLRPVSVRRTWNEPTAW